MKRRQAELFQQACLKDQQAIESEVMRRAEFKEETKRVLDQQLAMKNTAERIEKAAEGLLIKTTFGPEEDDAVYDANGGRRNEAKENTKTALLALMKEKEER